MLIVQCSMVLRLLATLRLVPVRIGTSPTVRAILFMVVFICLRISMLPRSILWLFTIMVVARLCRVISNLHMRLSIGTLWVMWLISLSPVVLQVLVRSGHRAMLIPLVVVLPRISSRELRKSARLIHLLIRIRLVVWVHRMVALWPSTCKHRPISLLPLFRMPVLPTTPVIGARAIGAITTARCRWPIAILGVIASCMSIRVRCSMPIRSTHHCCCSMVMPIPMCRSSRVCRCSLLWNF